jgi:hypothetical protein
MPQALAQSPAADHDRPAALDADSWSLKAADGRSLEVTYAIDPVMDLKAWARAGHRIESNIVDRRTGDALSAQQRCRLLPRDFEQIDLAALECGLERVARLESVDRPRLIIQLSFVSLSNSGARAKLLNRAREHQQVLRMAAICELVDIEPGIPVGRLTEVTSLVAGFFRGVWSPVQASRLSVDAACAAKASGLTIRAADLGEEPAQIAAGMRAFMNLTARHKALTVVTSLPTNDLLIDAMMAGFSHATLRAGQPDSLAPPTAPPARME